MTCTHCTHWPRRRDPMGAVKPIRLALAFLAAPIAGVVVFEAIALPPRVA